MRTTNVSTTNSLVLLWNLRTLGFVKLAFTMAPTNVGGSLFSTTSGVKFTPDHIFG